MAIRTSYHHNKDGSVTKRTTVSRKTVFGNRVSNTYTEVVSRPGQPQQRQHKTKNMRKIWKWIGIAFAVLFILGLFVGK